MTVMLPVLDQIHRHHEKMGCIMRKPAFCRCQNKGADQLQINIEADQQLCFHYVDSTISLLSKSDFKPLAIFSGWTAGILLDLV